jgi:hypothetical protein
MNRSRIVIPTTAPDPPMPHFDDEATVVSARQVVPIAMARVVERKRAALWISLILLGSATFGALGAVGINYFGNGQRSALVSAGQNEITRPPVPQTPMPNDSEATPKPETAAGGPSASPSPQPAVAQPANVNQPNDSSATVLSQASSARTTGNRSANAANIASEPGQLVRKRRVHPLTRHELVSSPAKQNSETPRAREPDSRDIRRSKPAIDGPLMLPSRWFFLSVGVCEFKLRRKSRDDKQKEFVE